MTVLELAREAGVGRSYFCRVVRLGFLAPQLVEAILHGRHSPGLTAKRLSLQSRLAPAGATIDHDPERGIDGAAALAAFASRDAPAASCPTRQGSATTAEAFDPPEVKVATAAGRGGRDRFREFWEDRPALGSIAECGGQHLCARIG
jgi:hypothetical protein